MKVGPALKKESTFLGAAIIIMSILMQLVFISLNRWNYTVLLGNIFGGGVAWLDFFVMGLTIEKAVTLDEKQGISRIRLSQTIRLFVKAGVIVIGIIAPVFDPVATIIPLFFPRVAVAVRGFFIKKKGGGK